MAPIKKTETITQRPEDGFVGHQEISHMEYRKGYGKGITFETDDPKVTRPFICIFCGVFALLLLLGFGYGILCAKDAFQRVLLCILLAGMEAFVVYGLILGLRTIKNHEMDLMEKTTGIKCGKERSKDTVGVPFLCIFYGFIILLVIAVGVFCFISTQDIPRRICMCVVFGGAVVFYVRMLLRGTKTPLSETEATGKEEEKDA